MVMKYSEFAEVYDELGKISGKLEKEKILAGFLKNLDNFSLSLIFC